MAESVPLKNKAIAIAKRKAIAEAKKQVTNQAKAAIGIGFDALGTGLYVFATASAIAVLNLNPLNIARVLIGDALQQRLPLDLVSDTAPAGAVSATGQKVANQALQWAGKNYRPGVSAQCAYFVRQIFDDLGLEIDYSKGATFNGGSYASPGLAGSFFSDEIGIKISRSELQPGDLIAFRDTYGNFPAGTITHVGIYTGDGKMVDRSTRSAPVYHRSVDHFGDKFLFGVRPHFYK